MRSIVVAAVTMIGCGRLGFSQDPGAPSDSASNDGVARDGDTSGIDGVAADATTFLAAFTNLPATGAPSARRATGAAVATDDRIWVFGGFVGGVGAQNTLAAYTPSSGTWATLTGSNTPAARERHVIGWDASNGVLVLFSGYSATLSYYDELYVYTPGTNAWTQIPKAGSWPAARKDAAMVWMPSLNQMLVYGGNNGAGTANRFSDLWLLSVNPSGPSATWTQLSPGGAAPPAQSAPCAAYDPAGQRFLVYGGQTQDTTAVATTYQYLVGSNVWQLDATTGTSPGGRAFSECAWDPVAGRVVLYGGQDSAGNPLAGQYAYDPDTKQWDQLALQGSTSPGAMGDGGTAYSSALGGVFWFGGRTGGSTYSNSCWLFDLQ